MLLPSLYYIKDLKKIGRRILGFLIPCFVFLGYLLITNCFMQFLDLCLFGLFDFAVGNGKKINIYWLLFIGIVFVTIFFIKKDRRNIANYYILSFYTILIPLFDAYHFQLMFMAFLLLILDKVNLPIRLNIKLLVFGIIIGVMGVTAIKRFECKIIYPNDIKYFEYRMMDTTSIEFTKDVNAFLLENKGKDFVFLNSNAYYFRIINDMRIGYLDLINMGNWGYDGSEKMFLDVKSRKDAIFIVDSSELSEIKQTDKRTLKYVMKNGKKIKTIGIYDIYVFE